MATGILRRLALASAPARSPAPGSLSIQQVYEAHFRYVWRCLRGLGVNEHVLEDAAHDVFLVVQRKLVSFDGQDAQVTTWLYEIALRVAHRYRVQAAKEARRWVSVAPPQADDVEVAPAAHGGDMQSALEHTERLTLARHALDALDVEKREAFVLGCIEQRSAPEIARITGVPLNTVYSRIRAARRAFAAQLARRESALGRRAR
jgi:RNA polymerase sigma-70 factor, ECF subfamily